MTEKLAATTEKFKEIDQLKNELQQMEPLREQIKDLKRKLGESIATEEDTRAKVQRLQSEPNQLKEKTIFYVQDIENVAMQFEESFREEQENIDNILGILNTCRGTGTRVFIPHNEILQLHL